jgi:hypothetical protein
LFTNRLLWLGASAGALPLRGSGCRNLALPGVYQQASTLFLNSYLDFLFAELDAHNTSVVSLRGKYVQRFFSLKKAKKWIDTHPPGWQPAYEKVRYIGCLDGKERSIFLRDPVVVGNIWWCGKFLKGPLLKGTDVTQDGTTADLLPFLIELIDVIERIPMRLDPYSKQLQELAEVTVE